MAYTTINKPSATAFNTVLYTGTGANQDVTGTGFTADLIWLKERSHADYHFLCDSVRGIGSNGHYYNLSSNVSSAESNQTSGINTIGSDGFSITTRGEMNENGHTYASWNWLANGTGSANTDGSISSTVSANTTSGFSIVSYTGTGANATVGHGLGVAPKMIIVKNRDNIDNWTVYHGTQGGTKVQWLNLTNATATESGWWNNTDPTSSVFYIGTQNGVNKSGDNLIAYCFAEKKGFSKFGSYVGNGNADGTFVYTGFKPSFLLIKNTSATQSWWQWDNKRIGYNGGGNHRFRTNGNDSEFTDATSKVDLLSNGFKWRDGDNAYNYSGNTFIYMAFAEAPLVGTNNVPCTAR